MKPFKRRGSPVPSGECRDIQGFPFTVIVMTIPRIVACDAEEQSPIPDIEIQVGMEQPWTHYFDVAISVTGMAQDQMTFVMPVWTPGSYLVREFARNVEGFSAC